MHTTSSKKFLGCPSFTELVQKGVANLEAFVFNYIAPRNPNFIYFLKSCILFFFGTFIPGYVFMVVEGRLEKEFKQKTYPQFKTSLIKSMYESIDNETEFRNVLASYESQIAQYFQLYPLIMLNLEEHIWDLWTGFFYSYTVYTTLGYGEIYPLTKVGRILTILYAVIGIPLFLLFLRDLGILFTRLVKYVWMLLRRLYHTGSCRRHRETHMEDVFVEKKVDSDLQQHAPTPTSHKLNDISSVAPNATVNSEDTVTQEVSTFEIDDEFNLPIPVALFILCIYIFLGAILYSYFEEWDVFDSFYYVFICLSTIGFGDFIPHHPTCEIISLFYECFGKAFMAMTIELFSERLSHSFHTSLKSSSDLWDMDDSGSERSFDIVEFDRDASVHKIINIEELEDASLGIKRAKSVYRPSKFRSEYFTTLKNDPIPVTVVGNWEERVVVHCDSSFRKGKVEETSRIRDAGDGDFDVADIDV